MRVCDGLGFGARRRSWRMLVVAVLGVLLVNVGLARATEAQTGGRDHVYLLRGAFNVFSLGLDTIGSTLESHGISTTVANYMSWASLAEEAAAGYKSGQIRRIVIVGHSSGGTAVTYMAARLGQLGVPVRLAIGLAPTTRVVASGRVERYVNFYVPGVFGTVVERGQGFDGDLENVNMERDPSGIGHFSFDKDPVLQIRVVRTIESALKGAPSRQKPGRLPRAASPKPTVQARAPASRPAVQAQVRAASSNGSDQARSRRSAPLAGSSSADASPSR